MKVIEPIIICRNLFSENKTIMAAKNGIVAITKPILGNKIRYKIKLIKAITVDLVLRGSSWNSSLFSTVFIVKIELINNEIDKTRRKIYLPTGKKLVPEYQEDS